ncbi:MAG: NAD(P)(+) transhydrogenase (Re/Si-specific) subunit alpha, partial [Planctomycetota bacterium]|nr:NAD(P)(+) transhydrogenase (Re/Si-specific) subunit alpha [Planctomycetota bacterium]
GQRIEAHGVTILGPTNLPAELPLHASQMYSRNATEFVMELAPAGAIRLDMENEVIRDSLITHEGEIRHQPTRAALGMEAAT